MPETAEDIDQELQLLEIELKRLEAEYNMFFSGRLPTPPRDTRARVSRLVARIDARHFSGYGNRFRFSTLQSRFATFVNLWDRGLRAKEEGRPGPFTHLRASPAVPVARVRDRILNVATFTDPARENAKLRDLYRSVGEARAEVGEAPIAFDGFVQLVRDQVLTARKRGLAEVAFRVALKDGKVAFTARGLKGRSGGEKGG